MSATPHLLIVEDSETQALRLRLVLEEQGWTVTCASNAEEALEVLNTEEPDVIVVDFYLPGLRGDELCRRLRQNVTTRGIPILMLTVAEDDNAEQRGLESGADDYISKSVDPDILVLRIRALLRKSRAQSSIFAGTDVFRKARLLAIDDSATYLEFLTHELESEGYQVQKASGGEHGLSLLESGDFDCVLVDLIMPELDGVQVCERISKLRPAMDNPIVVLMLTSRDSKEDMTRGLEAGADDFVSKSNEVAVLKARIRALLRRKFFQEENQRIIQELKNKELETVRARAEKEAAEARAALAEKLEITNRELEATNQKLRETQAHLIQTEKMASLGELVAGIAHEINNPVAFVVNHLFTIERDVKKLVPEAEPHLESESRRKLAKVETRLLEMREGLDRVKELVLQLRMFSRLDEGEFKTVDIHRSIDAVLRFLQHKMDGRIEVERRYGDVAELSCYAGQLNQVLMNLVANSVDAIEDQGKITVATGRDNGTYWISVRDTGTGIPEDVRGRIFDPFFTTKPMGEGTGLGLAISYGIIQSHRGTIDVESEVDKGTEFTIRIPHDLKG